VIPLRASVATSFLLILPDLKVIEDAIQVAQKIVDSFCKPFSLTPIDLPQILVPHVKLEFCHFLFLNSGMPLALENDNSRNYVA